MEEAEAVTVPLTSPRNCWWWWPGGSGRWHWRRGAAVGAHLTVARPLAELVLIQPETVYVLPLEHPGTTW